MKQKYLLSIFLVVFGIFFGISANVYAQVKSTDVVLQISPANPGPNESVTATIESYVTDLNKTLLTWSVNGETLAQGIGKKTFLFNTGDLSTELNLTVSIDTVSGETFTKTILLNSGAVDMLWEATDSYVPPFYKGKAMVGKEGMFKVVAIPSSGSGSSIKNLSYDWKHNGKVSQNASGWGKNAMIFKNSYLDTADEVSVEVSDIFGKPKGTGKATLTPSDPKILFYQKDPSGIKMEKFITDGYTIKKEGESIVAIPYFISPKNLNSANLSFAWTLGGEDISADSPKNELSVKPKTGTKGESTIKLHLTNTKTLFQEVTKEIGVNF